MTSRACGASSGTTWRHIHQCCGQPCRSTIGVAGARLGHVEAQPAGRDRAVRDAVELRQVI